MAFLIVSIASPSLTFFKSAIFDSLTFCIYDKSTRANKATHILNNNKDWFKCKFSFELNGIEYFIERHAYKKPNDAVKVDVKFWYCDEDGNEVSLNGEDRDQTNKAIRDYVGTYDDFVMTSLSTQYDNQSFVEKSQRERKDLLYKFLDISVYDDLYKIAKEISKEQQILIREFERENLHERSSILYLEIEHDQSELVSLSDQIDLIKINIKETTDQIIDLNQQYTRLDSNSLDLTAIYAQITKENDQLVQCVADVEKLRNSLNITLEEISMLESKIHGFELNHELESTYNQHKETSVWLENELYRCDREIDELVKKVDHLKNHEYDPTCQFCIKNPFVQDATFAVTLLPDLQRKRLSKEMDLQTNNQLIDEIGIELKVYREKLEVMSQVQKLRLNADSLIANEETLKYKGTAIRERILKLKKDEDEYHRNEAILTKNKEIVEKIDSLKTDLRLSSQEETQLQDNYNRVYGKLESNRKEYKLCQDKLSKYLISLKKYRNYELYLSALTRDGVPYKILEQVLPVIEMGVNEILGQITNFTVKIEANDDKYIHAFICHSNSESYPIELTSGMERFVIALAFRTALNDITSLPKPNFLAIDEGFGVLDSENLSSLGRLFDYLKNQYEYLLCISHIDSMKDLVDKQITIEKINGYSRIDVRT